MRTGTPARSASRRQSSNSGDAPSTRLPSAANLTDTVPKRVFTLASERASTARSMRTRRTPNVVELPKKACSTGPTTSAGANADTCHAGRPFFMRIEVVHTSTAPAAKRADISGSINWGLMSSRLASSKTTSGAEAGRARPSASPSKTRKTLARSETSRVPAPKP